MTGLDPRASERSNHPMAPSPYTLEGAVKVLSDLGGTLTVIAPGLWSAHDHAVSTALHQLVTAGVERLRGRRSPERADLLAATHTALAYEAFFDALPDTLVSAAVPASEQLTLTFTTTRVLLPWAGCPFQANRDASVQSLHSELAHLYVEAASSPEALTDVVGRSLDRYDAGYGMLAAEVREFDLWAMPDGPAAARTAGGQVADSLARLERLMASLTETTRDEADHVRRLSAGFNRAVLNEPLITAGISHDLPALKVPTIEDGYLSPSFRSMVMSGDARPASESWWAGATAEHTDLDAFLAAYFSSPQSFDRPLVVLGHPGSGKSMFTKVCAARLSGSDAFSAARIPLRQVPDPSAPIYQQVTAVLSKATNGRVSWPDLSSASANATRVLFIDGLDEFMQASGTAESSFLQNVVEFQRVEAITSHPVAVVVTSRTLVADMARIPDGCLVIKLEDFSPGQVQTCLDIWQNANPRLRHSNLAGIPSAESVLSYGDLARQPLLLLLLVLYGVSNGLPPMEKDSSPAHIYGGILRRFIRRELGKPTDAEAVGDEETQVHAELWRLGIAAFGMFNRGKHYIEEHTLLDDLHALDPVSRPRKTPRGGVALNAARRVLGRFFFIHASEADEGLEGRSYEFLHATFSEYLVAYITMTEIAELWNSRDRPSSQDWDDDRLYALLSHQTFDSGGSAILPFLEQLHAAPDVRSHAGRMLRILLSEASDRWDSGRYGAYSPSSGNYLERFAIYTGNLILILLRLESGPVALTSIFHESAYNQWPKLVRIWQKYLGFEFLESMTVVADQDWAVIRHERFDEQSVVHAEWLGLSRIDATIFNAGHGIIGNDYSIGSSDIEIGAMGQVARAFVDPTAVRDAHLSVISLSYATERDRPRDYTACLLTAHVANSPELFTYEDVQALAPFAIPGSRSAAAWPLSLIAAQYPQLAEEAEVAAHAEWVDVTGPPFAALLAGALVWRDHWPLGARILSRAPGDLYGPLEDLRPWIDGMAGLVDERRQVLVVAGHLASVLDKRLHEASAEDEIDVAPRSAGGDAEAVQA
ncbi:NACHT domain-containing protein [Dactylosporangium cerinum]|uniref:NACHT domain-containing protein n=1 Tax=Dactylosporangium cerinum TaxID=1434730 RepID=A0ABV9W885_9ACTN